MTSGTHQCRICQVERTLQYFPELSASQGVAGTAGETDKPRVRGSGRNTRYCCTFVDAAVGQSCQKKESDRLFNARQSGAFRVCE